MDWYPLWNSLRIAAISTVVIFFAGIFAAYYIAKLPRLVKGVLDVLLTLPLVLGLEQKDLAMLVVTFLVSIITLASGRTHMMQGAVHLVLFAAFIFLAFVP